MVTQQVKAVKNVSKIGRTGKKKKKSEGETINTSRSFALCTSWMPVAAEDAQRSKPGGTPSPFQAPPGGGFLLPKQELPMSAGPPASLCHVEPLRAPCLPHTHRTRGSHHRWEPRAPEGASLSSPHPTSLRRGQEQDFLMHIQKKIPLFLHCLFFF